VSHHGSKPLANSGSAAPWLARQAGPPASRAMLSTYQPSSIVLMSLVKRANVD